MSDPEKSILQEEVKGIIPAIALTDEGGMLQCGLAFATNILIVAIMASKIAQIAGALRTPDYDMMKMGWENWFANKSATSLLNNKKYNNYIIPYSEITKIEASETGRIRKKTLLFVHTRQRAYTFKCMVGKETLDRDVSQLLQQSGVRFSKGFSSPT